MKFFSFFNISFVREFTIKLNCSKDVFLKALSTNVDTSGYEFFEAFKSGTPFKGTVTHDQFKIRRRLTTMNQQANLIEISGTVKEQDNSCVVSIEADAFNGQIAIMSVMFTIFAVVIVAAALLVPNLDIPTRLGFIGFAIAIIAIMSFVIRQQLGDLGDNIEKEFTFIVHQYKRAAK
ncbi:MAG TPA: hypothetical protein VFE50_00035 [Cyclobacteriaceae bacterium]|nr:hypothetical protein [Cyclobacteriaceae bacterium]